MGPPAREQCGALRGHSVAIKPRINHRPPDVDCQQHKPDRHRNRLQDEKGHRAENATHRPVNLTDNIPRLKRPPRVSGRSPGTSSTTCSVVCSSWRGDRSNSTTVAEIASGKANWAAGATKRKNGAKHHDVPDADAGRKSATAHWTEFCRGLRRGLRQANDIEAHPSVLILNCHPRTHAAAAWSRVARARLILARISAPFARQTYGLGLALRWAR
jgi:hypothetical protein